jgi:ATP-dependent DNA ligase
VDNSWPPRVLPMLATARQLSRSGAGYGWERKYEGARCGAWLRPDRQVRLDSRNGNDITRTFPGSPKRSPRRCPAGGRICDGFRVG